MTLTLLAVAGGAAAPRIDLGASSGGFTLLLDILTILVVAASATGLALLVSSFRVRKTAPMHIERRRRSLAGLVVLVAVIVLITLLPDPRPRDGQGPTVGLGASGEQTDTPVAIEPDRPLVVSALVGAAVLAALAAVARRRLDGQVTTPDTSTSDDEARLQRTILGVRTDLEGIDDPREAVLRAYERLRIGLQDAGVEPLVDDTPRQVVRRAMAHPGIPAGPVEDLVAAFEEARFSTHSVGAAQRERALEALSQIERWLDVTAPSP